MYFSPGRKNWQDISKDTAGFDAVYLLPSDMGLCVMTTCRNSLSSHLLMLVQMFSSGSLLTARTSKPPRKCDKHMVEVVDVHVYLVLWLGSINRNALKVSRVSLYEHLTKD